ncbi:hypothetical protein SYNPS1DRAFT_12653 [Syncephalis pseudoplumigaleata]|uniref:Roadblock/LAMTOR2 domain-containing protein n=1 Tax=Syncephalis pseudoplumigaleata TaxID=1712513 RepID=A0A4P9Z4U9_9FUNG|nr:hypothetical protein SYNPS1DRAFT_12653 [Syncephalis pseudoplumigaleata]|eukprot:RKP27448.1 hypothetical protein SYNPS1DRAFT_12653 [Syncephalis pseudoplumigaleata]
MCGVRARLAGHPAAWTQSSSSDPSFTPRGPSDITAPTEFNIEETVERIASRKGVHGVVILNRQGMAVRSTLPIDMTRQYAHLLSGLVQQTRNVVQDLDSENQLTFMRIRTKKHELMIAPSPEYLLVVIQNPQEHYQ